MLGRDICPIPNLPKKQKEWDVPLEEARSYQPIMATTIITNVRTFGELKQPACSFWEMERPNLVTNLIIFGPHMCQFHSSSCLDTPVLWRRRSFNMAKFSLLMVETKAKLAFPLVKLFLLLLASFQQRVWEYINLPSRKFELAG